jgi:uncharacterized OB-fold protein
MSNADFSIARYREFLVQRKIMACRCLECGQIYLPPRPICRDSLSRRMEWIELSGAGTIVAFTVIKVAPTSMAGRGFGSDRPYTSGYIALSEGPIIPARVEAPGNQLRVGLPVKADFEPVSKDDLKEVALIFRLA